MIDFAKNRNTGVIIEAPLPTDLYFGNDRIVHTINREGSWLPYFPKGEMQIGTYYDTCACVTFSALNIIEAQMNYLIRTGNIEVQNLEWLYENEYINAAGDVEFSDRFTAKMSNTDPNVGNTTSNVWWSIRNHGLVPESRWAWDRGRDIPNQEKFVEWYYQLIPKNIKDLGLEFRERFEIFYERVQITDTRTELIAALKHSPIQVIIAPGCPLQAGVHQRCTQNFGHALALFDDRVLPQNYYPLFDHYINDDSADGQNRFIRKVSENYIFYYYGYASTITERPMENNFVKILKDRNSKAVGFFIPATSPDALATMALAFGKTIVKTTPADIDWDKTIEGYYDLRPEPVSGSTTLTHNPVADKNVA